MGSKDNRDPLRAGGCTGGKEEAFAAEGGLIRGLQLGLVGWRQVGQAGYPGSDAIAKEWGAHREAWLRLIEAKRSRVAGGARALRRR